MAERLPFHYKQKNSIMKKISYLLMAAAGLFFGACDDFEFPNPPAQSNPQEPIFELNGIKIIQHAEALNLTSLNDNNGYGDVIVTELTNFPGNSSLDMVMQISTTEDFATAYDVETTSKVDALTTSADGTTTTGQAVTYVNADDLDGVYRKITKDPSAATLYARFAAYIITNGQKVRVGGPDVYYGPISFKLTPFTPDQVIESEYYLAWAPEGGKFTKANMVKLNHSSKSPYDDPIFSIVHEFTSDAVNAGLHWKVIPGSEVAAENYKGGYTATEPYSESGTMAAVGEEIAYAIYDGPVLYTFNMETMAFNYMVAIPCFWTPGDANNWGFSQGASMYTNDYINYFGFVNVGSEFKFSPTAAWSGDFGADAAFTFSLTNDGYYQGGGVANGGNNIKAPAAGLYKITLNYATRETNMTQIITWGLIGGFNGWSESVAMTQGSTPCIWTGTVKMSKGDEWKFRANNGWDINLGGNLAGLTEGGDNIKCAEDGTYTVTLNLSSYPYTATVVKQ